MNRDLKAFLLACLILIVCGAIIYLSAYLAVVGQ